MTVVDNNPGDHQLVMYELVGEVGEARANLVLSLAWVLGPAIESRQGTFLTFYDVILTISKRPD